MIHLKSMDIIGNEKDFSEARSKSAFIELVLHPVKNLYALNPRNNAAKPDDYQTNKEMATHSLK